TANAPRGPISNQTVSTHSKCDVTPSYVWKKPTSHNTCGKELKIYHYARGAEPIAVGPDTGWGLRKSKCRGEITTPGELGLIAGSPDGPCVYRLSSSYPWFYLNFFYFLLPLDCGQ